MPARVNPIRDLGKGLLSVQNPVRYLGGEYGQVVKDSADLTFALAFPDLYEIGMSNLAVKIIYDGLNRIERVRCERVFAPAPDFEGLLESSGVPLYTLESGIPLRDADVIGFSLGYEPGITGLLSTLASGGVPVEAGARGEGDPIVLAGGCGVTNPQPFSRFVDVFFIGEAEAGLFDLVAELARMRASGASRSDLLSRMEAHPSCWSSRKDAARAPNVPCARRAIHSGFGNPAEDPPCFPVPNMRVVHDHGSLEIMRGCPNGCRFCHAGLYYRPQRVKDPARVIADAEFLVSRGGYREISLLSLSSGDYPGIGGLIDSLTARFAGRNVSFQLPSLKVNTFTLPLLERMAEVRKSGLTFAVETPVDAWQLALNKEVCLDRVVDILREAKRRGWSGAKFYFMIGLPVNLAGRNEADEIANFLLEVQARTRMQCTANVGTFIPKPHTPYQWARQLGVAEAQESVARIKAALPRGPFKLSAQFPFTSFLESMLSRGDERVGSIVLEAWKRGCRLDAWDDWARPDIWKEVIAEADWDVERETLRERSLDERLPWDGVSLGPSKAFLRREKERSDASLLTGRCLPECAEACGVCGVDIGVSESAASSPEDGREIVGAPAPIDVIRPDAGRPVPPAKAANPPEATHRVVVSFTKEEEIAFVPHLSLLETWNKAFVRSALPVIFTEGFNPLPRFEIAQSLSLGVSSAREIASFLLYRAVDESEILDALNRNLPPRLRVTRAFVYPLSRKRKREALSTLLWGGEYEYRFFDAGRAAQLRAEPAVDEFLSATPGLSVELDECANSWRVRVPFEADRPLRDRVAEAAGAQIHETFSVHRVDTLARGVNEPTESAELAGPIDFFDAFALIAERNRAQT